MERLRNLARKLRRELDDLEHQLACAQNEYCRAKGGSIDEETALNRRNTLYDLIRRKEEELKEAKKAPPILLHNLPKEERKGMQVLFFMHMPPHFRALSEISFVAQESLLPSRQRSKLSNVVDFYPGADGWNIEMAIEFFVKGSWSGHFAYRGKYHEPVRTPSSEGKVVLRSGLEPPTNFGPCRVDLLSPGNCGIWYPDSFSRQHAYSTVKGSTDFINPFANIDKNHRILTHTEVLKAPHESLQWAMPMWTTNDTRENWGLAMQAERGKSGLSKSEFLAAGALRACPVQQMRKLCLALKDRGLPLVHAGVRDLIRMTLYQLGEMCIDTETGLASPIVHRDLADETFLGVLHGEVSSIVEEIRHMPRDHEAVIILGEMSSFLADFDPRFRELRLELAKIALQWADDLEEQMQRPDVTGAPTLRVKQRVFCLYALACFRAGELDYGDVVVMLQALMMASNGTVFPEKITLTTPWLT